MNSALLSKFNILIAYGCVLVVLIVGSSITHYLTQAFPDRDYTNLRLRVRTWWMIVPPLFIAISIGPLAIGIIFAIASTLALREYLALIKGGTPPFAVRAVVYCAVPMQYLWAYAGSGFAWMAALYGLILFVTVYVSSGAPQRWLVARSLLLGVMLTVLSLSHVVRIAMLPEGAGLVIFLLIITQMNDVSQYVWGKSFGRTPLAPTLSPNKTCEGMVGGLATSAVLAALLGPLLIPCNSLIAAALGVVLALAGVAGDLTVSALKRHAGVKDTGKLLPGHGGILDRVDSLIYTAPVFFYAMLVVL